MSLNSEDGTLIEILKRREKQKEHEEKGADMVTIVITMCVRPEKDQELLVTLQELKSLKRQANGYVGTTVHRDPEEKQVITLCEHWQTRKDLEDYMQSPAFEVLRGAIDILTASAEMEIMTGNGEKQE
jgi:quinol monooxygenase YgiN